MGAFVFLRFAKQDSILRDCQLIFEALIVRWKILERILAYTICSADLKWVVLSRLGALPRGDPFVRTWTLKI